jgi:hypothetical protein
MSNKFSQALNALSPTELENLSFDLLQKLGMRNCVWRTPGRDGGRDIQGEYFIEDISGYLQKQTWYVDCKKYSKSLSWPNVWEKISFADSHSADSLLIITSSSLSPQAIDEVNNWNRVPNRLKIRFWSGVDIESKLKLYPEISIKYGLSDNPVKDAALALLPLTKILLKFSYSAQACQEFEQKPDSKFLVIYALSELISIRLSDFSQYNKLNTYKFRKNKDSFDWLLGDDKVEILSLDRYSFRAIICYLYDYFSKNKSLDLHLNSSNKEIFLSIEQIIPDYIVNDLTEIALMSNIRLQVKNDRLIFRGL